LACLQPFDLLDKRISSILKEIMSTDVIIIGAGAAGLMCAIEAGKRGRSVLLLDHNKKVGEKIRISGGGRCNFTNRKVNPSNYISQNPHFCTSALARNTPTDFISLIENHDIQYHEREHGQLFCDGSAEQIIQMLIADCRKADVEIQTGINILKIEKNESFELFTDKPRIVTSSLVIATGGLSIPKLGSTDFGLKVAEKFGLKVIAPKPGLVPLTFNDKNFKPFHELSGISLDVEVSCNGISFREKMLITQRGLSGPAILQISSYWNAGDPLTINLLPDIDIVRELDKQRTTKKHLSTILEQFLPIRFVKVWLEQFGGAKVMHHYSSAALKEVAQALMHWAIIPSGTEGYQKAEVTVGGIDTAELSSKTMEVKKIPGLYFIGEIVDVTGWLGGYNFQWAWSSGWAAGQVV
jgi:predicted Rossmann fold flavoprotein